MNEGQATPTATPDLSAQHNLFSTVILQLPVDGFVEKTVNDIEWAYKRLDSFRSIANVQTANIESVKEYLIDNYDDMGSHAGEIATLLDIELTRDVTYTVSMTATVTVTCSPDDDAESLITDALFIDANSNYINVDEYEVDYINEA
jgi:hypothetical protein